MRHDAMLMIRTDLLNRIDALAGQCGHVKLARLCAEVDTIRRTARTYGLEPLERLATKLETALAFDGKGAVIHSYLDLMRDAAGCEDARPEVASTYLAALSLRLGA